LPPFSSSSRGESIGSCCRSGVRKPSEAVIPRAWV
jgi:hypothetical protein